MSKRYGAMEQTVCSTCFLTEDDAVTPITRAWPTGVKTGPPGYRFELFAGGLNKRAGWVNPTNPDNWNIVTDDISASFKCIAKFKSLYVSTVLFLFQLSLVIYVGIVEVTVTELWLAVWLSGNALALINVVALRQTRLIPRWVIVCGRVNHLGM